MARNLDEPTSVPDDTPAGATERREDTPAPDRSDVVREDGAAAVEQTMQAPAKVEYKNRVASLRAMGREKFVEQTRQVAGRLIKAIEAAAGGPVPERVRTSESEVLRQLYRQSVDRMRGAELADDTPHGVIVIDTSFDPVNPVSLLIKRDGMVVYGGIHWALWQTVEKALSSEDKEFIGTVRLKVGLEERIFEYQRARMSLQQAGFDLDDLRLFEDDPPAVDE
jgi:hypothetical protein